MLDFCFSIAEGGGGSVGEDGWSQGDIAGIVEADMGRSDAPVLCSFTDMYTNVVVLVVFATEFNVR